MAKPSAKPKSQSAFGRFVSNYYSLTKPGIIFGNVITLMGGYFLASQGQFNVVILLFSMLGMVLVIASGCVFNNCIDQDIDQLMERTKNRLIARGEISIKAALSFAILLAILGFAVLAWGTNMLTVVVSLIGLFFYVVVYSLWFKRHSVFGTTVGGVAGAVPPVVGYCAVTNRFDAGAIILFSILFFWQMPHSYAIAIFRLKDYAAAKIPVLPVEKGIAHAKLSMMFYIPFFTLAAVMPYFCGYAGFLYFIVALSIGVLWFFKGLRNYYKLDDNAWAKKMFFFSIIGITLLSVMMAFAPL